MQRLVLSLTVVLVTLICVDYFFMPIPEIAMQITLWVTIIFFLIHIILKRVHKK